MSDDDLRQAIDQLINSAKMRGSITQRAFDTICQDYLIRPDVLAARFLSKTGRNWHEYQLNTPKNQNDNMAAALHVSRVRFEQGKDWWDNYKTLTGSIFTSKNRKYIYIGSKLDGNEQLIHHFVRVKDLQTMIADWSDLYEEFPSLKNILLEM